jgi:hypothetical protein
VNLLHDEYGGWTAGGKKPGGQQQQPGHQRHERGLADDMMSFAYEAVLLSSMNADFPS